MPIDYVESAREWADGQFHYCKKANARVIKGKSADLTTKHHLWNVWELKCVQELLDQCDDMCCWMGTELFGRIQ